MQPIRIRPRSSIADPELARGAVVDLPTAPTPRRLRTPRALLDAVASFRGTSDEPERVIVLTLVPVAARRR
jgi:hypothetical protein